MEQIRKMVCRYKRMARYRDGAYLQEYNNDCLRKIVSFTLLIAFVLGLDLLTYYLFGEGGNESSERAICQVTGCLLASGIIAWGAQHKKVSPRVRGWGRNAALLVLLFFYMRAIYYELQIGGGLYIYVISLLIFGGVINLRMREIAAIILGANSVVIYASWIDGISIANNQIYLSPARMLAFCTLSAFALSLRRNFEYLILICQRSQLRNASEVDTLTGLLNRRGMEEKIRRNNIRGQVCVAIFDIDDFKKYNDTFGHAAGDKCLRLVASLLQEAADRYKAVAVRYGGEEMVLVFFGAKRDKVREILRRLLAELYAMNKPAGRNADLKVLSMSCGLISSRRDPGHNVEDYYALIAEADKNLYVAKRCGKNCVIG